jgi:hypothetical protein
MHVNFRLVWTQLTVKNALAYWKAKSFIVKNLQLDQHLFLKNLFIGRTNTLLAGYTKLFATVIFAPTL